MSDTFDPTRILTKELGLPSHHISAVLKLLEDGNTVPFIARYRKEMTGSMDELAIRTIAERFEALTELDKRRNAILESISGQGLLTDELRKAILACATKTQLEDLYLPYRPKRRTRATIARERGLEPLARLILSQPRDIDPMTRAAQFVDAEKGVPDADAALAGARDIVAEVVSDRADVRALLRDAMNTRALICSQAIKSKTQEPTRFESYYDFSEPVSTIPSHRYLAIKRGEREGVLRVSISFDFESMLPKIRGLMGYMPKSTFASELATAVGDSLSRLVIPSLENEIHNAVTERSDLAAVEVFSSNLRELLMASPLGGQAVVGIDPGIRTGCKCAAVDATGRFLGNTTIYIHDGGTGAAKELSSFLKKHNPKAIAVGNGTYGRETLAFVRKVLQENQLEAIVVPVSESGASVYSASEVARAEFPDLDLTVRGAISIARRLQDPLAELVKVDPRSIGVGQYQHDVSETLLKKRLDDVVESCVNAVGVDVNTASASLLSYVSGIGPVLAANIVAKRDSDGPYKKRSDLLKVPKLGPKTFLQAAGFLRILGGLEPLDASAVHPERYSLVKRIAGDLKKSVASLIGQPETLAKIDLRPYVEGEVGLPTLNDIIAELGRPGRDPRESFKAPEFREDVSTIEDLKVGMQLAGVVTNVTAFGAFVDIGVHQDGLVHISELSNRFIKDPAEVVKAGQHVKVQVLQVDVQRKRISLSMRTV